MSSKNNFFSRQETQCDHCGLKVSRHNIAAHTRNVHPNQKVKERAQKQKTLDHLLTARSETHANRFVQHTLIVHSPQ